MSSMSLSWDIMDVGALRRPSLQHLRSRGTTRRLRSKDGLNRSVLCMRSPQGEHNQLDYSDPPFIPCRYSSVMFYHGAELSDLYSRLDPKSWRYESEIKEIRQ